MSFSRDVSAEEEEEGEGQREEARGGRDTRRWAMRERAVVAQGKAWRVREVLQRAATGCFCEEGNVRRTRTRVSGVS